MNRPLLALTAMCAERAVRQINALYLRHLNRPIEQRPTQAAKLLAI